MANKIFKLKGVKATGFLLVKACTVLFALIGFANSGIALYEWIRTEFRKSELLATIVRVDRQLPDYDLVEIEFRNPSNEIESIRNLRIVCDNAVENDIFVANNFPESWKPFNSIETIPLSIEAGLAKKLEVITLKEPGEKSSLDNCDYLNTKWQDINDEVVTGSQISYPKETVFFTHTLM